MSYMEYSESIELYAAPCREIQNENGVRFAAVIDHSGKKIAGGFKDGITPLRVMNRNYKISSRLQ